MTMPVDIFLEYGRVGDLSSGSIYTRTGEARTVYLYFEGLAFDAMLYELARKLEQYLEANVFLLRSDRGGALPYKLDSATVELLRSDPVAAVHAMTYPGSPVMLFRQARAHDKRLQPPNLRAGFDVLADSFGIRVYVRLLLNHDLECPGCGYWSPFSGGLFQCKKRCRVELAMVTEGNWAGVLVTDLLRTNVERFYLPRRWNAGIWITREHLEEMYSEFTNEKERATCTTIPA
jgi:hypothetical protein